MQIARKTETKRAGPVRRLFARFCKATGGNTAVEFALVGMPFFLLLMATVEITMSYFVTIQLENGLETVARQVRTGQVQTGNMTAVQFRNLLCAQIAPLIPCDGNLYIDVRVFDSFTNVNPASPLDANGNVNMAFQFDPGQSGSIVLARAFYAWKINTPMIGEFLSNMSAQSKLVTATQVFRNEPWAASP